ncbi:MAG: amino acid adenylation domain-containing protein [Opitutaceae bacterium]|nr:amino acid adenylation domain-containing protein [Opitutaceae bacterium]
MTVRDELVPTRVEPSGSQRALLEERLKRARQAATKPAERGASIPLRTDTGEIPLSFAQERLWFLDQLEPGSPVYNVCQAVRMRGTLDINLLEKSINDVIRRHEPLRTNFITSEGRAVQVVAPTRTLTLTVVDLSEWRDGTAEEELLRRLREEARRPFDFSRDLLIRVLLIRTSATEHTLLLTMHHIISDGWSIGILFRELAALYTGYCSNEPPAVPELPIQFADYVLWERENLQGPVLEKLLAYWKKQLGGPLPVLELPVDHPRSVAPMSRGAAQAVQLSRPLTQALKSLGQQEGATLFMTLLAAFQVLLHRWTGQEDIVVGSVVAGRRKVELEKLIGFFVNTLVFRGDLAGNPAFRELLARVRETSLGALAHQDVPFERVVTELRPDRTISRNPLFQVMFVLQNAPMAPTDLPRLMLEPLDVDTGTTKFDLTLSMFEGPQGLRAAFEYNADLFEPGTISRMLGCFQTLLESIVASPEQKISRLALLTPAERHQVLSGWNQTWSEYPREKTVPELFAEQVARTPESTAVSFAEEEITYRHLDARANQLARRLQRMGVGPDTLVGVCLERSVELIVALLGILKAGGTYVSLDPAYPKERLAYMLADTRARVLLTQQRLRATVEAFAAAEPCRPDEHPPEVISLDTEWAKIAVESEEQVAATAKPEHLAYVSYTSGSTGRPKGVCVPHRGVVRLVKNSDFARFDTDEVFLQFAPIAFDASTLEIWGALLNGARLVICPPGPASLAELGELIERSGVTTLWLTAGLFHQMVEEQLDRLQNVRQLLAGGDVLSPVHVTRALEQMPRTELINGYGPTENTTFTCCHRVTAPPLPGRSVPIGRPIANTQVYILDREMQPVPMGVPGELFAGGDGLARGYLNLAELTQEKFVPHPFSRDPSARLYRTGDLVRWLPDGSIEFLGRIDRQVKIRGFRVEPGEIEAVLTSHPSVRECAVVVRDDPSGAKCLVAYIVPKHFPAPAPDTLRAFLEEKIPEYLMPSVFAAVDVMPLNANGKVDVAALPSFDGSRPELQGKYIGPRDEVEANLTEIWENVLGVKPIGVHDRFFDLGGHSLLAVRVVAQVEKWFGKKLPVAAIFQHRTIEQLARLLRANETRYASVTSLVEIQGHGTRAPLYLVHGVGGGMFWGYSNLARHLGTDQPLYAFKSRGLDGLPEWPTIEEMAANYIADLRAHQPRGPYLLGGYCFGGIVAYEMARQLHGQGERVALLGLMNCSPPNTDYNQPAPRRALAWQAKFMANLAYWIGCFLFSWTLRERIEFVRWKLRILRKKAAAPLGLASKDDLPTRDVDELVNLAAYSDKQRSLWESHVRALIRYRPQPYAGRVTLFRTRGHALICSFDEQYGWGPLARGGVAVKLMPGGHGNILDEPHVRAVAQALQGCLHEVGAKQEVSK